MSETLMHVCPKCGGRPAIDDWRKPIPIRAFDFAVFCGECSDDQPAPVYGETLAEAATAWNRHVADAEVR